MTRNFDNVVKVWLIICALLVFAMVLLGGAVRLTGSGLSMVDWRPIMGLLPPIGESNWMEAFAQYKLFPEYQRVNTAMTLDQFQFIYLMEYAHRLLGRLIGLVFFLPFVWFLVTCKLNQRLAARLWVLFAMGGLQGLAGWYMVKSGLVDNPAVSQYRLALHLMLAVIIYAYMIRIITGIRDVPEDGGGGFSVPAGMLMLGLVLAMIASGAFVAGTHAGFILNTFPRMGNEWIPAQVWSMQTGWKNLFENPVTVQFIHRCLALVVLATALLFARHVWHRAPSHGRLLASLLVAAVMIQVTLGISTLLMRVPVAMGVAHQAGALVLLTVTVCIVSLQSRPVAMRYSRVGSE